MPRYAIVPALSLMTFTLFWVFASAHLLPVFRARERRDVLRVLVVPHMLRHVGAMALYPGLAAVPDAWSVPLAIGDVATAALAALALIALDRRWSSAIVLTWVFNLFGVVDLLHNGVSAVRLGLAPQLGVIAYVVAFGVPVMLGVHLLIFWALLTRSDAKPDLAA